MDPQTVDSATWAQINRGMVQLVLFVALAITAALALVLGYGILPSLVSSDEAPVGVLRLRRLLLPLGALAIVLMAIALARALLYVTDVMAHVYPRFAI